MKEYLEKTLHQAVAVMPFVSPKKLPPYFASNYHLEIASIANSRFLLATPKAELGLGLLRKEEKQLEKMTGFVVTLVLDKLNFYSRDRLIEENIPFIVPNKQVYLPFLGLALLGKGDRYLKPCAKISFLTQKLLLTALYMKWRQVTVSKASLLLGVTKISITRAYDEIESLGLTYVTKASRTRLFSSPSSKRKMWEEIHPFLRSPLLQELPLASALHLDAPYGGLSALAAYSLLNDNPYPTYALTKDKITKAIEGKTLAPLGEEAKTLVQEVGYFIPFPSKQALDPLSVALLYEDKDDGNERIDKAVMTMLEEQVWSKD